LTEDHWGYLEYRLVTMAIKAKRSTLMNETVPQPRKLSEAQLSDMEAFLKQLEVILPVLGVNVLRTRTILPVGDSEPSASPTFTLNRRSGVRAQAQVVGDEFIMLEGSLVVGNWSAVGSSASTRRSYASYREQHQKLIADGSIAVEGKLGRLTRDVPFPSPSTACAIAVGTSCNGRLSWKWEGGTYADWEDRDLPAAAEES
jgi:hypothetical protein